MTEAGIQGQLKEISLRVQGEFEASRRVLSFAEYLELFAEQPLRSARDASRYLRDVFDYFGRTEVKRPWGTVTRYGLFDLPFEAEAEARRGALVGQEVVQHEVYRAISNFVREARANRLILMHGPNGSAKSTLAACLMRALEHYSTLDVGALYRFHWVFPKKTVLRGAIGFQGVATGSAVPDSYAHLAEEEIDARLLAEVRDHPLFLLPDQPRAALLDRLFKNAGAAEPPPEWLVRGGLSHKNRQVFEALLVAYQGSLEDVLRHVQVERYFISRRYRVGAVTLGPQLSVDAGERQVTADRSLSALPSSLQAITLFEVFGELVDAAGGLLEFSDLLKRPLDAYKYLQITAETGEVALRSQILRVNCVMMASSNEIHLAAFREHPEFDSFRGRMDPVRVPYLLSYLDEQRIYDGQVAGHVRIPVAPHATRVAAMFAVLTRMVKPEPDLFDPELGTLLGSLTAWEKMELYALGEPPRRLDDSASKLLRSGIPALYRSGQAQATYEGQRGASPREMRTVLLDSAQNPRFNCLSPFAVLEELDRLCLRRAEYGWLEEDSKSGGYHDHEGFRKLIRQYLLDVLEDEFRVASGLVDETRYTELFDRYIRNVSHWVKGEKLKSSLTGDYHEPDERMMGEVEVLLGALGDSHAFRHSLINQAAVWAIEHPGTPVDSRQVFAVQLKRLRDTAFVEKRSLIARLCRDSLSLVKGDGGLDQPRRSAARQLLDGLASRFGYHDMAAADAAIALLRERFEGLAG